MDIQINDASIFRRSVDAIRDFLPQAQVRVTEAGLSISGMDSSHVGFVDYFLSAEDCKQLRIDQNSIVGISMTTLSRVLATAGNGAEGLTLSVSSGGEVLKVSFKTDGRSANFELPTLDIQEDAVDLPELSYSAVVKAKTADIAGMIKDLAIFGDEAVLCLDEEGFHVHVSGDTGKGELTMEPDDDREMTMEGDAVELSFGMKYLQQIIKSSSGLAAYMEVSFDPANPLRVRNLFGKSSHFIAYLAPKVQG
jgi:proliferating cell nuclear antigen